MFQRKIALLAALWALSGIAAAGRAIDNAALANEQDGRNWASISRTFSEQRYSPLDLINDRNVTRLGLAWSLDLPGINSVSSEPIAVDGVLYFAVGQAIVHAVNVRTGKLLWRYDPEVAKVAGHKLRLAWGSRGVAFWKGKVYVGTLDGRLIAIDAKTGRPSWSVQTTEAQDDRFISGAPRVFNDKVIIGHGGGDLGDTRGYVTAYDAATGRQAWRFWTVPGDPAKGFENKAMEMAAKTWNGQWWKFGGGGTVWNAMTYDPEFNRIYLGTGNGTPWNQKIRSPGGGDNLFLCSVVALDADTGEYVWHYQTNPGETWDYNSAMEMVLATRVIDGKPRKVLMHAPKNGFFYVIDRETGKLISAEKIGKATWAEKIDLVTGRPVENPEARYPNGEALVWPSSRGVHNVQPMSYSPKTGLAYVPTTTLPGFYSDKGIDIKNWQPTPHRVSGGVQNINIDPPADAGTSDLIAWDPLKQQEVWKHPTPGIINGGTTVTAGNLVFQGQIDGKLNAYAADSGKLLWSRFVGNGILTAPITYRVGNKQYLSVIIGVGGAAGLYGSLTAQHGWHANVHPRRVLTFVLDGNAVLPSSPPPIQSLPMDDPSFVVDPVKANAGMASFGSRCLICHGLGAVSGGTAPDLRASPIPLSAQAFEQVVRQGSLQARGMPGMGEIGDEELDALRHYLRQRARETRKPLSM
jgi:quinohemoprotein ethanol dehydrogenase